MFCQSLNLKCLHTIRYQVYATCAADLPATSACPRRPPWLSTCPFRGPLRQKASRGPGSDIATGGRAIARPAHREHCTVGQAPDKKSCGLWRALVTYSREMVLASQVA